MHMLQETKVPQFVILLLSVPFFDSGMIRQFSTRFLDLVTSQTGLI